MKKYIIDYVFALFCSLLLAFLIWFKIGGDMAESGMAFGFMFGIPLGSSLGVYLSRKTQRLETHFINIIPSAIIVFILCLLLTYLLNLPGSEILFILPFLLPIMAILGFGVNIYKKITTSSLYINHKLATIIAIILLSAIVLLSVYIFLSLASYGSLKGFMNKCEYTEEISSIPEILKNSQIILEKDAYTIKGSFPDNSHCTANLKSINNSIVSKNEKDLLEGLSKKIESEKLSSGKTFILEKIIVKARNGINADPNNNKSISLILKDDANEEYIIEAKNLDSKISDLLLVNMSYYKDGARIGQLSSEMFSKL